MDINSISSGVVTQSKMQQTGDAIGIHVAKKALDIQSNVANQLIDSVKQSTPPSEPHLGNKINVQA